MRHYRRRNICMHAWLRMYMYVGGGHAKKHAYVALLVLIFLCKSSPTHIYVRTFVCMYVCMYLCIYTCIGLCTLCLRKKCAKLFLSELCQMSINFNNFWQVDEKMAKIICYINIFHLTSLMSSQFLVKQKSAKLL